MSEPAFSAPAAHQPVSFRQFYIDRSYGENEDLDAVAAKIGEQEGYRVVRYATKETPIMHGTKVLRTMRLVVEPLYTSRTGVPGCCMPGAMPDHYPNPTCRSGKRPHCTCDGCF